MSTVLAFRERLRIALNADPRTRPEIAKAAGYSAAHLRRLVSGARRAPTLELVDAMAGALGVSPAWLLGLSEERT